MKFKSMYPGEESQLDFAYQLGYAFKSRQSNIISIKRFSSTQGYNLRFEEIVTRRLQIRNEWVTATIIKGNFGEEATIYFKGPHHIIDLMVAGSSRVDTFTKKAEAEFYERRGMQSVAFAKRSMETSSLEILSRLLAEIKMGGSQSESELNEFLLTQASQLYLMGTLGLSPITNMRETLVLEELEKNGVKLWLFSEDTEQVNKVDYEAIDLFDNYHAPFKIKGTNEREVENSLK